jgi:hypothetical protein
MEQLIKKTAKSLEKRGIKSWAAPHAEAARKVILEIVSSDATVGIGDSSTVRQIGVIEALKARGNQVNNPFDPMKEIKDLQSNFDYLFWPSIEASICDVFLTGSNALTEDGKIVNVDGAGNRVAGMFWGHPVSILVVGKNKIVKNLDEALKRIKNVVAPEHIRRKGMSSPCTKTGRCHDCLGEERVCAVTTIIERRPVMTEIHVVIVNEDLGLSWDRSWPQERVNRIIARHEKFMCLCPLPRTVLKKIDIGELWRMAKQKRTNRMAG